MVLNGIDVDLFQGYVDSVRQNPETGPVTTAVRHRWGEASPSTGAARRWQTGEVVPRTHQVFRTDWLEPVRQGQGADTRGDTARSGRRVRRYARPIRQPTTRFSRNRVSP